MGTGHFFGISRAPLRYRAFPTCLEGDKLLLCETILQRGALSMQVIINWQAFFIADPWSWSQLSQVLQPYWFYGHPWVLEQLLAGTRTRLTNHPQNISNTCGLHGERSAEPIPARGGYFVVAHHPVALPALQWCSFSACRTPEKNPGATDQEPSTLVQDQCTWSWALSSEQWLEQTYSLHEMCIVWLAYNKADDQSWMIISLVSQVLRSYQDLYNAVSMTVPWFIFSKVGKRKRVPFSLYSALWNGAGFIGLSHLHRQQGIQIHGWKNHTGFQRLSWKPSWQAQQVFSKSLEAF